jgi:hypothetical protein
LVKFDSPVTNEEKILLAILEQAQEINAKLQPQQKNIEYPVAKGIECKYCGGTHENKGQMLACARKKKKEGA